MPYQPNLLVLTLSRKCNLECGHCIVEGEPRITERLDFGLIRRVLPQARSSGINSVLIYGGEPFLFINDLLPQTLRSVYHEGFTDVQIGTNGFWGHSEEQAKKTLEEMEQIASQGDSSLRISLSIDQYHQPKVPPKSLANIIGQFRIGDFSHLCLGVQTFGDQESFDVVGEVYEQCRRNGFFLVESNGQGYLYPALKAEYVRFSREFYPFICNQLKLPTDSDEKQILGALAQHLDIAEAIRDITPPDVIACQVNIGGEVDNYLIFPDKRFYIDFLVEKKVISAGRARKPGQLETTSHDSDSDLLVISPNGLAYAYPAQITAQEGITIGDKPLSQVIYEVRKKLY